MSTAFFGRLQTHVKTVTSFVSSPSTIARPEPSGCPPPFRPLSNTKDRPKAGDKQRDDALYDRQLSHHLAQMKDSFPLSSHPKAARPLPTIIADPCLSTLAAGRGWTAIDPIAGV